MMNQFTGNGHPYRFSGRTGRDPRSGDRAPYRRPMGRGSLSTYPYAGQGESRGGCSCVPGNRPNDRPLNRRDDRGQLPESRNSHVGEQTVTTLAVGACGCGNQTDSGHKLLEQIRAVDFALYEVILYLDVYPHSCDALETYHKLKAQREALHREYESTHGPLTAFGNQSNTAWNWIGSPFPWEYGAE